MKFLSYVFVAIIAFVAAIFITNGDFDKSSEYDFSNTDNTSVEYQEPTEYTTYYSQLNDFQKSIYDALLEPVKNMEESVTFSNVDYGEFKKNCFTATKALQYDHPELFWFTSGYTQKTSRSRFDEKSQIVIEPMYYSYATGFFDSEKKSEELQNAVSNVADLARKHSSNGYDQIMFVHDYLVKNAIYDHDALNEYYKTSRSPSCEYIFSAYGCLVEGKTVCSGYAKAFQLVVRELGYDCLYVVGDAGEAHGWNCVYLDGEGYYVDVTWDDPDMEKEIPLYDYAFITSEMLSKTHTVDAEFEEPVCVSDDYNYFRYYGYYLDKYSYSAAAEILENQSHKGYAFIQFGSMEETEDAYRELVSNRGYRTISGIKNFNETYLNDQHYIIGFYNK